MKNVEIGIIADTHFYDKKTEIPSVIKEALEGVDFIVHGGDVSEPIVLSKLEEIAPVKAVMGNKTDDIANFKGVLPENIRFEINGVRFLVEHGSQKLETDLDVFMGRDKQDLDREKWMIYKLKRLAKFAGFKKYSNFWTVRRLAQKCGPEIDCIIFGHTHQPYVGYYHNILFLNPGDAQYARKKQGNLIRLCVTPEGHTIPQLVDLCFTYDE